MTIGTNFQVCPVDASWSDYAAHSTAEQERWREAYALASEQARQAAFFQAAQAVIIAGIQAAAADRAADKQYEIADRQMQIAEAEYERYKEHFICTEHALADDACVDELYEPDYETRPNRSIVDVRKQFGIARQQLRRTMNRYCMQDFMHDTCDLAAKEARAVAAAKDAGYRYEEELGDRYSDRRFNRRIQVANIGRGIQAQQVSTYAGAMDLANQSIATRLNGFNNFLGAVSGGISGIIQTNLAAQIAPLATMGPSYMFNTGGPAPIGGAPVGTGNVY